ncbi:MAG: PP2C family protein-serine/threonine phosphatase, partial [Planctomycetota bacterium]
EGVMSQVKLQTASRQLLKRTQEIERDLQQAMQMQRFLLPDQRLEGEGWRIGHLYRPVEYLGGDFLDLYLRPDGRWAVLVADVSGHGTSAALTAAMAKTAFLRAAPSVETPSGLLGAIHRALVGTVPPGHFMTAQAALFDPARRQVEMASAGHPHPLLVSGSRAEPVALTNELVLLVEPDQEYTRQATLTLSPGDRLLLYTDGAVEAAAPDGNRLTTTGLARYAGEVVGEHPWDFLEALFSRGVRSQGKNPHPDPPPRAGDGIRHRSDSPQRHRGHRDSTEKDRAGAGIPNSESLTPNSSLSHRLWR